MPSQPTGAGYTTHLLHKPFTDWSLPTTSWQESCLARFVSTALCTSQGVLEEEEEEEEGRGTRGTRGEARGQGLKPRPAGDVIREIRKPQSVTHLSDIYPHLTPDCPPYSPSLGPLPQHFTPSRGREEGQGKLWAEN